MSGKSFSPLGDGCVPSRCVTLMPYTLVSPRFPPICRPVLLLPTLLGRVLHKRLAEQEGFQLCEPGKNTHYFKFFNKLFYQVKVFFLTKRKRKGEKINNDTIEKTLITVRNSGLSPSINKELFLFKAL